MIYRQISKIELVKILKFYEFVGYNGSAKKNDLIVCAEKNKTIIGVVRLCLENNVLVLRGMYVSKKYQKLGIGTGLLTYIDKKIGKRKCYCIPYSYLENFYRRIGFKKIKPSSSPKHLFQRYQLYLKDRMDVIIMERHFN